MNLPKPQNAALIAASFVALLCLAMLYEITRVLTARLDGPSFSTDQMIASLGVMVTGLGLFIAMATAGIAVLAIFGITELRTAAERKAEVVAERRAESAAEKKATEVAERKAEEVAVKKAEERVNLYLARLQDKGLMDAGELYQFQQAGILPDKYSATNIPIQESTSTEKAPVTEDTGDAGSQLSEYPEGEEDQTS